jgi:hypothetical protein
MHDAQVEYSHKLEYINHQSEFSAQFYQPIREVHDA